MYYLPKEDNHKNLRTSAILTGEKVFIKKDDKPGKSGNKIIRNKYQKWNIYLKKRPPYSSGLLC